MPSPVAHSLIGLAVGRTVQPRRPEPAFAWVAFMLFTANAPDLDFLAGLASHGVNDLHRGPSHTLTAALVYGAAAAWLLQWVGWRGWRTFATAASIYASHVLLDACTGTSHQSAGVRLFWPLTDRLFASPWLVFQGIRHGESGDTLAVFISELTSRHNIVQLQYELLISMPFLLVSYYFFHCPFRQRASSSTASEPHARRKPAVSEA